jgi:hypothetical protein
LQGDGAEGAGSHCAWRFRDQNYIYPVDALQISRTIIEGTEKVHDGSSAVEKDGCFSTKSLYKQMSFGGVKSRRMKEILEAKVPLKVGTFLW